MRIHFYRGSGFLGWAIRWRTWGKYAHVAIEIDGWIYEAIEGKGVIKRAICSSPEKCNPCNCQEKSDLVLKAPKAIKGRAKRFLEDQVGKPYDYWAILGFVSRRNRQEDDKFFCSELLAEMMVHCGLPLFDRVDAWKISPSLASISPNLREA